MRYVTIDVECWRRIILDNQHEFPVLRNDYAWSCGIHILNNQEGRITYNPVLTILQGTNRLYITAILTFLRDQFYVIGNYL